MNIIHELDMVDLARLHQCIALLKDFATLISTIILAVVAILGLQTWKKQLKGKTEYELARRLLLSVYKTREAIRQVRNPYASGTEISQSLVQANVETDQHDPDYQYKSQAALYQSRWKAIQDALSDLNLESFEAEVVWGKEIKGLLIPFRRQLGELLSHIELYLHYLKNPPMSGDAQRLSEKIDEVIYEFHDLTNVDSDNSFTQKTVEAIMKIEDYLRPKLKL